MSKCPWKSLFGEPRTGSHAARIPVIDIALTDTFMTALGAWGIQYCIFPDVSYWKVSTDKLPGVAKACGIKSLPTFKIYRNGEEVPT